MEQKYLFPKTALQQFFGAMAAFGKVMAPVRVSDQSFAFKEVTSPDEIAFEALRTILPPKKFLYPQQEVIVRYNDGVFEEVRPQPERRVLFGVHPCDLAGLGVMDTIFSASPADPGYLQRRAMTLVVGLSCMPDKHCFCQSMGTDAPTKGYDLFLTDLAEEYFAQVSTPAGASLLQGLNAVRAATAADVDRLKHFWTCRSEAFTTGFQSSNLPALMDAEWNNPLWNELGDRCLSCGNCTPVCPTCYCFDIVDVASLHEDAGERRREWDSCQFVGFAKVAGEFNFRPGPVDRLKFWYRHKLHGFDDPYGLPTCVGCGRCTVSCPSGIDDIVGLVVRLQEAKEGQT